jgi:hypothetical protein
MTQVERKTGLATLSYPTAHREEREVRGAHEDPLVEFFAIFASFALLRDDAVTH